MQKIRNIHSRYVQSSRHTACSSVGKLSAAVINNRMKFSGWPVWWKSLVEPQCHLIGKLYCVCVRVCVCSLLFTLLKISFADGIFSWMKMYLLFVKRAEFQKQEVYIKCLKREKIEIKTQKACIVYNSLFLLKFKFAAKRANAPSLAEVTAVVQSCNATFAKTDEKGSIFNILAVYVYCYYIVVFLCEHLH